MSEIETRSNGAQLEELAAEYQAGLDAANRGDERGARSHWQALLDRAPLFVPALQGLTQLALKQRDLLLGRDCLERLAELEPGNIQHLLQLAMIHRAAKSSELEEAALVKALALDPRDLMALLMRGALKESLSLPHEAVKFYQGALLVAQEMSDLPAALRPLLSKAELFCERYRQAYSHSVDREIELIGRQFSGPELDRFRLSLDIMFGRKKRYESQPMGYFFPRLEPLEFFDRARFPWLDAIEASSALIRDEFLAVLGQEEGFTPYLSYGSDQPLNQWAELNNSPRWSAFHLLKDGNAIAENAGRCPRTMACLGQAPQPVQLGRTPVAMFSLLKPRTRIPPHVGVSNARLVTHLPLIVPPHCGFRVGNTTRPWEFGKAWVFDDTIEHEAWNDSEQLRVVLIFDIWHPDLTEPERRMISALAQAQQRFAGVAGGFDL